VFDRVSVAHDGRTVVHQASFEIQAGEVVGWSGPRRREDHPRQPAPAVLHPDEGRVTIDGRDLRDVTLKSLREQIGIVTQHTILFDDTIRNNIAYANPGASLEAVEQAAEAAYAWRSCAPGPRSTDAHIGEAGVRLSGGSASASRLPGRCSGTRPS